MPNEPTPSTTVQAQPHLCELPDPGPTVASVPAFRLKAIWNAASAALGAVLGLVPHVAHHAGLLLGAAAVTGAAGNVALASLGLLLSIPMLRRLYRRYGTWRAPAVAVALFTAMFALSAFVIGPAVTSGPQPAGGPAVSPTTAPASPGQSGAGHAAHHTQ